MISDKAAFPSFHRRSPARPPRVSTTRVAAHRPHERARERHVPSANACAAACGEGLSKTPKWRASNNECEAHSFRFSDLDSKTQQLARDFPPGIQSPSTNAMPRSARCSS